MSEFSARLRPHCAGMLAVCALSVLSAAVFTWSQPPEFEVRASIIVSPAGDRGIERELALLRGSLLAEQVIIAAGPGQLFPDTDRQGQGRQFQERLRAEAGGGRVIQLSFYHPQAARAVLAVDTLISLFRLQREKLQDPQKAKLEEQAVLAVKQVRQAENRLALLGRPDAAQEEELAGQLNPLRQELAAAEAELLEQGQALAAIEKEYAGPEDGRADLLRLKLYERGLQERYEEQEPLLAEVRGQMRLVRSGMRQAGAAVEAVEALADRIVAAKAEWSSRKEAAEAARRRLAALEQQRRRLAGQQAAGSGMQAELAASKERQAALLAGLEGRRGAAGSVTVLEPPLPPLKPHRRNLPRNLLLAAVLGLGGGLLHALLRSRRKAV